MNILADTHTHTVASGHAYSTLDENARYASQIGLKLLAVTEHGPAMNGAPQRIYFSNLNIVPRTLHGVDILIGTEANIVDFEGGLDFDNELLKKMDIVIASLHQPCIIPGSKEENTNACLKVMENEYVDILGHPGDPRFPIDVEAVFYQAKQTNTLIEINNASLIPGGFRDGSDVFLKQFLMLSKKEGVPVVLSSDAHFYTKIGDFDFIFALLKQVDFPEELILNYWPQKLKQTLKRNKNNK